MEGSITLMWRRKVLRQSLPSSRRQRLLPASQMQRKTFSKLSTTTLRQKENWQGGCFSRTRTASKTSLRQNLRKQSAMEKSSSTWKTYLRASETRSMVGQVTGKSTNSLSRRCRPLLSSATRTFMSLLSRQLMSSFAACFHRSSLITCSWKRSGCWKCWNSLRAFSNFSRSLPRFRFSSSASTSLSYFPIIVRKPLWKQKSFDSDCSRYFLACCRSGRSSESLSRSETRLSLSSMTCVSFLSGSSKGFSQTWRAGLLWKAQTFLKSSTCFSMCLLTPASSSKPLPLLLRSSTSSGKQSRAGSMCSFSFFSPWQLQLGFSTGTWLLRQLQQSTSLFFSAASRKLWMPFRYPYSFAVSTCSLLTSFSSNTSGLVASSRCLNPANSEAVSSFEKHVRMPTSLTSSSSASSELPEQLPNLIWQIWKACGSPASKLLALNSRLSSGNSSFCGSRLLKQKRTSFFLEEGSSHSSISTQRSKISRYCTSLWQSPRSSYFSSSSSSSSSSRRLGRRSSLMKPSFLSITTASKAAERRASSLEEKGLPTMQALLQVELSGNLMMHLKQMLVVSMKWKQGRLGGLRLVKQLLSSSSAQLVFSSAPPFVGTFLQLGEYSISPIPSMLSFEICVIASWQIALIVLSQIFLYSSIREWSFCVVKITQREAFFRARPLIWMQDFRLKGVSKEMTRLQPGMSKPSSVTLVVMSTRCSLRLNSTIFLIWLEYFSSTSSSTLPIFEKQRRAISSVRFLLSPPSPSRLCSRCTRLLRISLSDSTKAWQNLLMAASPSTSEGLDWKEWPSFWRQTFCRLAYPVTPVLLQKLFSSSGSPLRYSSSTFCRNLTVRRLKAKTSTISLTFCFSSSPGCGFRMSSSFTTFELMKRSQQCPYSCASWQQCFFSSYSTSFSKLVLRIVRSPSSRPSSVTMSLKPSTKANSPSSSQRSRNLRSRHSLMSQKRQSSGSVMCEPSTSTRRQGCSFTISAITSCTHRKQFGKCVRILPQEVAWSLWRSKNSMSSGSSSRSSPSQMPSISIAVSLVTLSPNGQQAKLESRFAQSNRSSLVSSLQSLKGCETGEAVSPMIVGSRSLSSSLFASSSRRLLRFCSKQNSFMMPEQGWSPRQWWHSSSTTNEQSVIFRQPRRRQFRNICEIITVIVAFFISSRKALRLVIRLSIRFRFVIVWSSFRSPWMQITWLLRSSGFQLSWMYWLPRRCLKSRANPSFCRMDSRVILMASACCFTSWMVLARKTIFLLVPNLHRQQYMEQMEMRVLPVPVGRQIMLLRSREFSISVAWKGRRLILYFSFSLGRNSLSRCSYSSSSTSSSSSIASRMFSSSSDSPSSRTCASPSSNASSSLNYISEPASSSSSIGQGGSSSSSSSESITSSPSITSQPSSFCLAGRSLVVDSNGSSRDCWAREREKLYPSSASSGSLGWLRMLLGSQSDSIFSFDTSAFELK